jgi:hypothetical protein
MLGVEGDAELCHMAAVSALGVDARALQRWLPEGIGVSHIAGLSCKPVAIESLMSAAEYRIVPVWEGDCPDFGSAVEAFVGRESVPVTVVRKGKEHVKDIRPLVESLAVETGEGSCRLVAVLAARPANTCRPDHLLSSLFPDRHFGEFVVTRTRCLGGTVDRRTVLAG